MKRSSKLVTGVIGAAAVVLLTTTTAMAAVSFTPESGGFVGKGDVQLALGIQVDKMSSIEQAKIFFEVEASKRYEVECTWMTGPVWNRRTHVVDRPGLAKVKSSTATDTSRKNRNATVTGFTLSTLGMEAIVWENSLPQLGDICADSDLGTNGSVTAVTLSDDPTSYKMWVAYNSNRAQLPM
jgi:hypothetical protein